MKKIISFILLTASASCTILFAQAENRLEATNQVRGCRLQLVATNQTTNYRLQVEDNNKIELSSEGQIRQQAKPTTNCELRTTNCNNSGTDLSCYLMMDPEKLKQLEEGACLVDEVIEEEGSINHHLTINIEQEAAQTVSHTVEERIPREISLTNTHSITDPTSLSLFTETPEATAPVEQSVNSLNGNFIVQVLPIETMPIPILTGKSLGDRILALPSELISIFLRSPEKKQAVYKAEHQQTVLELQKKYPDFANNIAVWKQAVEEWSECPISGKDLRYQYVVALGVDMPFELYRLVDLSKAMKIIEDAIAYRNFLRLAFEKYDQDAQTEEAKIAATRSKIVLLAQLDTINNNLEKLESIADAIIRLSEQRNRCLALEVHESVDIREQFCTAARTAEQAITSYCQFGQKIKEGESTIAYQFRIKGLSLMCNALKKEYYGHTAMSENETQAENFNKIGTCARKAADLFEKAAQTKSEGKIEVAKAYEQTARYHFQTAQAAVDGDTTNANNFSKAAYHISKAAYNLGKVAQIKSEGQTEDTKTYEQTAQYHFQAVQAAVNGDSIQAKIYSRTKYNILCN